MVECAPLHAKLTLGACQRRHIRAQHPYDDLYRSPCTKCLDGLERCGGEVPVFREHRYERVEGSVPVRQGTSRRFLVKCSCGRTPERTVWAHQLHDACHLCGQDRARYRREHGQLDAVRQVGDSVILVDSEAWV